MFSFGHEGAEALRRREVLDSRSLFLHNRSLLCSHLAMKELRLSGGETRICSLSGGERFVVDGVESGGSARFIMPLPTPLPAPLLSGPPPACVR